MLVVGEELDCEECEASSLEQPTWLAGRDVEL